MNPSTIYKYNRITSVDSLRGIALAGIVIAHMVENFLGSAFPEGVETNMNVGIADDIVSFFMEVFIRGKFFALFSFLFGISFFIQMDTAAKKGKDFRLRFIWRLIILFAIGLIHSAVYRGDILTVYVLIGLILPLFYHVPNKWLLTIAGIFLLGLGRYVYVLVLGDQSFFGGKLMEPSSPHIIKYWNILNEGSWLDIAKDNLTNGLKDKFDFQFGVFARGYQTFAFFLLGLWVGRIRLFEKIEQFSSDFWNNPVTDEKTETKRKNSYPFKSSIITTLWCSLGGAVFFMILTMVMFSQTKQPVVFTDWLPVFALTAYDLFNFSMTILLVVSFILIFNARKNSILKGMAPYGRMALSNYIAQSIIGTYIFYGFGLGYIGQMRNIYAFLLSIALIVLQVYISKYWLKFFAYGPLEWAWRCLTHFKWYPLMKGEVKSD